MLANHTFKGDTSREDWGHKCRQN